MMRNKKLVLGLILVIVGVILVSGCVQQNQTETKSYKTTGFEFVEGCSVYKGTCSGEINKDGTVTLNIRLLEPHESHVFSGFIQDCEFSDEEKRLIAEGQQLDCLTRMTSPKVSAQCNAESTTIDKPVILKCQPLEAGLKYVFNFKVITFSTIPIEGLTCARIPEENRFKCISGGELRAIAK